MRDDKIYQMRNEEFRRMAAMARQLLFVETRQEAMELVMSSTSNVLRGIFNTSWLKRQIDQEQVKLLQGHEDRAREYREKERQEEAKPKLSIGANGLSKLVGFIFVLSFLGCVPRAYYQNKVEILEHANSECLAKVKTQDNEIKQKTDKLRRFNQINEDGSLRTKVNDDSKGWNESVDETY